MEHDRAVLGAPSSRTAHHETRYGLPWFRQSDDRYNLPASERSALLLQGVERLSVVFPYSRDLPNITFSDNVEDDCDLSFQRGDTIEVVNGCDQRWFVRDARGMLGCTFTSLVSLLSLTF
jgi:hypothetical protein